MLMAVPSMYTKCISNKKFTIWTLTTCHTTYEGKTNTTKPPDTVRTPVSAPKLFFCEAVTYVGEDSGTRRTNNTN